MMECSLEIKPYNAKKVMQWYVIKMETEKSRPARKTCLISSFSTSETEQALGEGQMQRALRYERCLERVLHVWL